MSAFERIAKSFDLSSVKPIDGRYLFGINKHGYALAYVPDGLTTTAYYAICDEIEMHACKPVPVIFAPFTTIVPQKDLFTFHKVA